MNIELIDIYDKNKQRTGKIKNRNKDILEEGEYVLAVSAAIINSNKKILISKRSKIKRSNPGKWEINCGVVLAGENSLQGIIREIKEELGIDLTKNKGILFKEYLKRQVFQDIWLFKLDVEISEVKFADNEVEEVKWVSIDEYEKLYKEDKLIHYNEFNYEDYDRCIQLLFND